MAETSLLRLFCEWWPSLSPQVLPTRTSIPFENNCCTEQIFMSYLELHACQKALGLRKQRHKQSLGARVHWLRSYTFPVLRDTVGLQKPADTANSTHRALKEGQGSERRSRQSTYRRYIRRHNLCPRETQGEHGLCSVEGYRTCAHTHLGRIQCSLGPKSQTKQTLTVFKNQCLQAQSISTVCIHMA